MTMSVRFRLSNDPLKWEFIAITSIEKRIVDTDVISGVCARTKVLSYVRPYDVYETTLSTDYNKTLTFFPLSV